MTKLIDDASQLSELLAAQFFQGHAVPGSFDDASQLPELLAALLSSISEGVVDCDEQGVLQSFNRAARVFHGEDLAKEEAEFLTFRTSL